MVPIIPPCTEALRVLWLDLLPGAPLGMEGCAKVVVAGASPGHQVPTTWLEHSELSSDLQQAVRCHMVGRLSRLVSRPGLLGPGACGCVWAHTWTHTPDLQMSCPVRTLSRNTCHREGFVRVRNKKLI